MHENDDRNFQRTLAILLLCIGLAWAVDLVLDRPERWLSFHVIYELTMALGAFGGAIWLVRRWRGAEETSRVLRRTLAERQAERDAWRKSAEQALAGMATAIAAQFDAWGLTPAEREVALLVLQGLGHKEIAVRTGRSERTVRQHAAASYEKAGLGGRAELAGFFLGDVVLPPAHRAPLGVPGPTSS